MASVSQILPLYRELNDLKRIRVAGRNGSIAHRLFRRSWSRLIKGEPLETVALSETANAVVAARLAGIDAQVLAGGGLDASERLEVLGRAFDAVTTALPAEFAARLRAQLSSKPLDSLTIPAVDGSIGSSSTRGKLVGNSSARNSSARNSSAGSNLIGDSSAGDSSVRGDSGDDSDGGPNGRIVGQKNGVEVLPEFIELLARQPRAGATRPGRARVVLEPTESHAEHCGIVAINGALAASLYDADAGQAFLTGLCHHFHNAYLPDAGDAGDALLGEHHAPMMARFRERALAQLPDSLSVLARASLDSVYRADTPESKAFQVADSLDRVLEMEWHARSAEFTLGMALQEMDIIHPGPVQAFQLEIMREAGLM